MADQVNFLAELKGGVFTIIIQHQHKTYNEFYNFYTVYNIEVSTENCCAFLLEVFLVAFTLTFFCFTFNCSSKTRSPEFGYIFSIDILSFNINQHVNFNMFQLFYTNHTTAFQSFTTTITTNSRCLSLIFYFSSYSAEVHIDYTSLNQSHDHAYVYVHDMPHACCIRIRPNYGLVRQSS